LQSLSHLWNLGREHITWEIDASITGNVDIASILSSIRQGNDEELLRRQGQILWHLGLWRFRSVEKAFFLLNWGNLAGTEVDGL